MRRLGIFVVEINVFIELIKFDGLLLAFVSIGFFVKGGLRGMVGLRGFCWIEFVVGKLENKIGGVNEMELFGMLIGEDILEVIKVVVIKMRGIRICV